MGISTSKATGLIFSFLLLTVILNACEKAETKDASQMTVEQLQSLAERGSPGAMVKLGLLYDVGRGVTQNVSEAMGWYRRAAVKGDANGQFRLGYCYFVGRGTARDYPEAVKWFRLSANSRYSWAQVALGEAYMKGLGVEKNDKEAFNWFQKAAVQKDENGEYLLAICYQRGIGTETNVTEAVGWFKKSAESGHVKAQVELAKCYSDGLGVNVNPEEAFKWYRQAADEGNLIAQQQTSIFYALAPITQNKQDDLIESYKWISVVNYKDSHLAGIALNIIKENGVTFSSEQINQGKQRADGFMRTNQWHSSERDAIELNPGSQP